MPGFQIQGASQNKASYAKIRRAIPDEGGSGGKIAESQREHVSISLTITATDHHPPRLSRGSGRGRDRVRVRVRGLSFFFLKNAV